MVMVRILQRLGAVERPLQRRGIWAGLRARGQEFE